MEKKEAHEILDNLKLGMPATPWQIKQALIATGDLKNDHRQENTVDIYNTYLPLLSGFEI